MFAQMCTSNFSLKNHVQCQKQLHYKMTRKCMKLQKANTLFRNGPVPYWKMEIFFTYLTAFVNCAWSFNIFER